MFSGLGPDTVPAGPQHPATQTTMPGPWDVQVRSWLGMLVDALAPETVNTTYRTIGGFEAAGLEVPSAKARRNSMQRTRRVHRHRYRPLC